MAITRKIRRSLKRDELYQTIGLCFRNLLPTPKKDHEPSQFDLTYGVSTEGRVELGDLKIDSPSEIFGFHYAPTPPVIFDGILSLLPVPEQYSFIDLGCGKGRVVLMAARQRFQRVIGVEFSQELCRIAEDNLARFRPHIAAGEVRVICEDAARFEFSAGPLIVYCYFAFSKEVLVPVLERLEKRADETLFVFYNPHYHEVFANFERLHEGPAFCIWRITRGKESDRPRTLGAEPCATANRGLESTRGA